MQIPHCTRCGREHYRFVACGNVDTWNERHAENKARQGNPKIQNRSTPDGMHEVIVGRFDTLKIPNRSVPEGYHVQSTSYWQAGGPDGEAA